MQNACWKPDVTQSCSLSIIHLPDATVYNVLLITLCLKVSKDNSNKNIFYIKVCMTLHSVRQLTVQVAVLVCGE